MVRPMRFSPRQIFGNSQTTSAKKTARKPKKTHGWLIAPQIPPKTAISSANDAPQLVKGSGDVLMITRLPALVT